VGEGIGGEAAKDKGFAAVGSSEFVVAPHKVLQPGQHRLGFRNR
jgi:hypothetical protein